jgi:hypothetical protein
VMRFMVIIILHKGLVEWCVPWLSKSAWDGLAGVVLAVDTPRDADALARAWAETRWGLSYC